MEWYWIMALVVGFFGVAGLMVYLGTKGSLNATTMDLVSKVISSASAAFDAIAGATESTALDVIAIVMTLVDKAVAAAENAYYNDEIGAEERTERCMVEFDKLLKAANITLTDAQRNVVGTLVAAACEELGHGTVEAKEKAEETKEE